MATKHQDWSDSMIATDAKNLSNDRSVEGATKLINDQVLSSSTLLICLLSSIVWCLPAYVLSLRRIRGLNPASTSLKLSLMVFFFFVCTGIILSLLQGSTFSELIGLTFLFILWGLFVAFLIWVTIEGTARGYQRKRRQLEQLQKKIQGSSESETQDNS
jgi:hypothetical protein